MLGATFHTFRLTSETNGNNRWTEQNVGRTELLNPSFMFSHPSRKVVRGQTSGIQKEVLEEDVSTCHSQGDHSDCEVLSLIYLTINRCSY